jgi:hypothetical protein
MYQKMKRSILESRKKLKTSVGKALQIIFFGGALLQILLPSSCSNPFKELSNQSSDQALYEEALKASNASQWVTAVIQFEKMSAGFLASRQVRFDYAKALAGRCGYDFFRFGDVISTTNFQGGSFFSQLLAMWGNREVLPQFCTQAELQVKTIWSGLASVTERTLSESFFIAFLSLAKMGMYLRFKADVDGQNGLGNGTPDNGVNACVAANPVTQSLRFSDDEIKEIITGLALFLFNLASMGTAVSNLDDISTALDVVCGPPINATFCTKVHASEITGAEVTLFRKMLQSQELGLTTSCSVLTCCL